MPDPKTGAVPGSTGGQPATLALGRQGETWVNPVLPPLAEAARNGWLYTASQAAAGVAPGTSATTTTPAFTLYMSANTSSWLYIVDVSAGYVSGTLGAGHIMFGTVASASTPTGGTAITAFNAKGSGSAVTACGTGHTTTAMSASTDRFPVLNINATLATAPAAGIGTGIDGVVRTPVDQWVPAGTVACFYGVTAAGTSPLIRMCVRFIEYPISALV